MKNYVIKFAEQFGSYRKKCGLTYRAMEAVTGIKYSALAAMMTGNRPVGEQSARRIALAFRLSGDTQEAFVLSALNTSKERVLQSVKEYPAEVLNALGLILAANGIEPKQILGCDLDAVAVQGHLNEIRFSLRGGRSAYLHISLTLGT